MGLAANARLGKSPSTSGDEQTLMLISMGRQPGAVQSSAARPWYGTDPVSPLRGSV